MKLIKFFRYLIEFLIIMILFLIFKIIGVKISSYVSGKIFRLIGPLLRPKKIIINNLKIALPHASANEIQNHISEMWNYYGRILAEYPFLNNFRNNSKTEMIKIKGKEILDNIIKNNENVIFVSGHFDNFELMAMTLEKSGIKLAAIYRPLNNFFMNKIIEILRIKYICKNQIKKGRSNIRNLLKLFNDGHSIALMIDQRVSESIQSPFFGKDAYTTTIPAQFVKKFKCKVVPIYIERKNNVNFEVTVYTPLNFEEKETINEITQKLNKNLEQMILLNPSKWIWSHNRWK